MDEAIKSSNKHRFFERLRENNESHPLYDAYYNPEQRDAAYIIKMNNWLLRYTHHPQSDAKNPGQRKEEMNSINPKYVLRNYLAQMANDRAETGGNSLMNILLDVLRLLYDEQAGRNNYAGKRPEWARNKPGCSMLSCSS